MSVQVIIIDKLGNKKEKKTKNYNELYKVCGYRNDNNFCKRNTWSVKIDKFTIEVELWAKKDGKANFENKYEFPPPVDKELYFGTCCLISYCNKDPVDLPIKLWTQIYDKLLGGVEDLGDNDSEVSEDSIEEHETTKEGYSKEDGFIVSDDEEDIEYFSNDELSEEECSDTEEENEK